MIKEESRFSERPVFEGMTSVRAVINALENGTSDRRIIRVMCAQSRVAARGKELSYLKRCSEKLGFCVDTVSDDIIDAMTTGSTHGGIIAECSARTIPHLAEAALPADGFYVMLEGIEDPYNFGYAVRSIYASGADGIVLSPRNWMTAAGVVARASAGTSEMIPLYVCEPTEAAEIFKTSGYKIVSAGIRDSVSAYDADLKKPLLLIIGGEKRGISRSLLEKSDCIVRLEYGRKFSGSLSAASAASILTYEVLRQNR